MKKDINIKWREEWRKTFGLIKDSISRYTFLVSLDYSKDFQIFLFASEDSIFKVLLQKNDEGSEQPIKFMGKSLQDVELKYAILEKKYYSLVKYLKHFWAYVGYSKIIAYIPHLMVKDILSQSDFLGFRRKWVSKIQ